MFSLLKHFRNVLLKEITLKATLSLVITMHAHYHIRKVFFLRQDVSKDVITLFCFMESVHKESH